MQIDTGIAAAGPEGLSGRSDNERAILSLLREEGPTPATRIARSIGVSAQSASVITRKLEAEGLILRGKPEKGRVGKPSIPIRLDPAGAYSIGMRIGRRRSDLILIDLEGRALSHRTLTYAYPTPDLCLDFARAGTKAYRRDLAPEAAARIAGIGIGMPFDLWSWLDFLRAPEAEMQAWHDFPAQDAFATATGLPALVGNDASLACHGEHLFGAAKSLRDFGYFYVGAFLGGGLVLGGSLYLGPGGNAGAFASLPVAAPGGHMAQLLEVASIHRLERYLEAQSENEAHRLLQAATWTGFPDILDAWIDETARHLANAALTVVAILDLPAIVVDGSFPDEIRSRLIARVEALILAADARGMRRPRILSGTLGTTACALGAAYRPLVGRHFIA